MPGYRKLGRPTAHRKSMLRNLVTDLLREGRIQTTEFRAKEAGREAEKLITLAKNTTKDTAVKNRRLASEVIFDEDVVAKLFDEIAPKYEERHGGYTRILKLGPRRGDAAEVVFLELV
ncbi:MAG: 50S ribosomal protein L17 [Firmicutes bacterium]|nr:50S ribosomal protein L17 [Bacillota bacterium]MBR3052886.1 50S ribosomal protein L17 [Bacillota bacterium]MBR3212122.1 50S ribosomal protein L17 [Bacillota bacterium]MCR4669313.1 50S ribosomal protein L17 [Clostridia bacterium]